MIEVLLASWMCIVLGLVATFSAMPGSAQAQGTVEGKKIEGRWVRPDGGYILQLENIKEDGSVTATYFNPRSIKVSRAEVRHKEGTNTVFVELRDVNYPGSTYTLDYDSIVDRLKGTYFQAATNQNFEVEFRRTQ